MNTHFSIGDPAVLSERYFEYYKARARGGVGLIITTHVKAEKNIDPYPLTYGYATFDSVSQIKYFNEITEMAHRYDAKIAIELSPGTGRLADATLKDKWPVGLRKLRYWVCRELKHGRLPRMRYTDLWRLMESGGIGKAGGF